MEKDQEETQALLQLLELGNEEIHEGKFSDAIAFLDEMDDPESSGSSSIELTAADASLSTVPRQASSPKAF